MRAQTCYHGNKGEMVGLKSHLNGKLRYLKETVGFNFVSQKRKKCKVAIIIVIFLMNILLPGESRFI